MTVMVRRRIIDSGIKVVSSSTGGAQAATVSIPAPSGLVAGNLLYAFAVYDDTNGTAPGSMKGDNGVWTEHVSTLFSTNNDNGYITGFYKVVTASEPASYVFAGSTVHAVAVGIVQLSGVNSTTPFGTPSKKNLASTVAASFNSVTLTGSLTSAVLVGAAQAGNFSGNVSNSITWGPGFVSAFASTSQYNQGTSYDAEVVMGALNKGVDACTYTPGTAKWNTAYLTGTIAVPLNHA